MFKPFLKKIMGFSDEKQAPAQPQQPQEKRPLSSKLDTNIQTLRELFNQCADIVFREITVDGDEPIHCLVIFADTLCEPSRINQFVLEPLLYIKRLPTGHKITTANILEQIPKYLLDNSHVAQTSDVLELSNLILAGNAGILFDGNTTAILAGAQGADSRAIDEPETEPNVRGPRDGFVESLMTNTSLLRRRIRSTRMKVELIEAGTFTKTKIGICYIQGLTDNGIVSEVKARLGRINMDGILASGYVEELISDEPIALFPLVQTTERPDKAAAALLEGRVVIIVDNTPSTLIAPCTFINLLQASDDYYITAPFATFIRFLRFIGLNIALLLPALTVAVFSFHQEMLPTALLTTAANARQNLPFPIAMEVLLMEVTFELLREAGLRLPKTIGQAVSTVGGLVIGQAAVDAGLVAPIPVIIVALTAIASFTIPNYIAGTSIRMLRFALILLASTLGYVGIMLGLMFILAHLASLRSFGIPYLRPFAPLSPTDLKDTFIRVPWWGMLTRPRLGGSKEPQRQDPDQGPKKPDGGEGRE